ncbi:killer toxin resistant protein, partial [Coemansia erecta]
MRIPQSIALLCLVLGGASATGTPPIRTQLYSSFAAPPLGLELAEGVAAHNHTSYFAFIEHLAQQQPEQTTPNGVYTHGLKWIEHTGLLTPVAQSLLRLEMATRVYAPAAEAQFQLYAANVVPELRAVRGEFDEECAVWAQYKDRQACTPAALQKILDSEAFYGTTYVEQAQVEPQVLALDHVYDADSGDASAKLVVLYADVRADGFLEFHEHLKGLADNGDIRYVLRYGPQAHGRSEKPLALSGYGVELALKSTEYKVTDDRDLGGNSGQRTRVTGQDVQGGGEALLFSAETEPVVRGLGETQLQRLGVQAAQMVISATDKLAVLRRLAQDLPRYAHLLAELPVNSTLADEIGSADALVGDAIVVNGVRLSDENLDPFHILDHLRRENTIIDSLQTAGLTQQQALGLLLNADAADDVDDEEGSDDDDSESEAMVFDMRDQSADQKTIWWLNDLESDKRYASWPSDTSRLLRVVTPGMMQPVRKNVVQTVFALDLSKAESWILVFEDMLGNIEHGMPMQFG